MLSGHKVAELQWNGLTRRWVIQETQHVKAVVVDDTDFPLRKVKAEGGAPFNYDEFVSMFDSRAEPNEVYEAEYIIDKRAIKAGRRKVDTEYLVKWKGYHKREATWEPATAAP